MQKLILISLIAILLSCGTQPAEVVVETESRPVPVNVLLIIIDTLRADHLSSYGYYRMTSPHIDSLAKEGTRWTNAQSQAPWTLPSHASIWTGLSVEAHGTGCWDRVKYALDTDLPALPEMMRSAGFRTCGITNCLLLSEAHGFAAGFDYYSCNYTGAERAKKAVGELLAWIDTDTLQEERFFAVLHLFDVHSPYEPPAPFDAIFDSAGTAGITYWECSEENIPIADPDLLAHLVNMYDGEIRWVDHELGKLFSELRKRGLTENTLIIITSDHGEGFLEHGRVDHGNSLFQELLHVPLIMSGPGITVGYVDSLNVGLFDLFPTILAAVGEPVPENIEGIDIFSGDVIPNRGISSSNAFIPFQITTDSMQADSTDIQSIATVFGMIKTIANMEDYIYYSYNLAADPGEEYPFDADSQSIEQIDWHWATPLVGSTEPVDYDSIDTGILQDLGYIR